MEDRITRRGERGSGRGMAAGAGMGHGSGGGSWSSSRFASVSAGGRGGDDEMDFDDEDMDDEGGGGGGSGTGRRGASGSSKTAQMHGISETMHVRVVFRARQTLLEILGGLGFDVKPHGNFTPAQIQVMKANDQLDMLIHHRSTPQGQRRVRDTSTSTSTTTAAETSTTVVVASSSMTQVESDEERSEYTRNRAKYAPYEGRKVYVKYAMTNRGKSIRSSYLKELVDEL